MKLALEIGLFSRYNRFMTDTRPHILKCRYFESVYPKKLVNNEWRHKFVIGKTVAGNTATYNPDYYSPEENCYIEVATSKPNISEQGWKWEKVIKSGEKLKVYWWEGNEITDSFI
jgi:hypothetical protein